MPAYMDLRWVAEVVVRFLVVRVACHSPWVAGRGGRVHVRDCGRSAAKAVEEAGWTMKEDADGLAGPEAASSWTFADGLHSGDEQWGCAASRGVSSRCTTRPAVVVHTGQEALAVVATAGGPGARQAGRDEEAVLVGPWQDAR